jgi:hypothetical protein
VGLKIFTKNQLLSSVLKDPKVKERVFEFERGRVPFTGIYELAVTSHPPLVSFKYN